MAASLVVNIALGEEPPDLEIHARAKQHFERGLDLAKSRQDWEGALREFLASRRLLPRSSATRNAAIALQELGRFAEALEMYQALIDEFSQELPADQLSTAQAETLKLMQRLGELKLDQLEPGTVVTVDGRTRGTAPLRLPVFLDPGVHTLRLSREGHQTREQQVRISPGKASAANASLEALKNSGVLSIRELRREPLEVFVDGAPVGKAPWRGSVSVGRHHVILGGDRRGTAPASAQVRLGEVTELVLEAVSLDVDAQVRPEPEAATVFVNGVFVGSGVWEGRLPSGLHRFEALAPGYRPFRKTYRFAVGEEVVIQAKLEKELAVPPTPEQPSIGLGLYVHASLGPSLGKSLGGALRSGCECSDYSPPFGWHGRLQVGYEIGPAFSLGASGGWLTVRERATRQLRALGDDDVVFTSNDYRDESIVSGPLIGLFGGVHVGQRFPINASIGLGLGRLNFESTNVGTYSGSIEVDGSRVTKSASLSDLEPVVKTWTPVMTTDLRAGYRFHRRVTLDLGMTLMLVAHREVVRQEVWPAFPDAAVGYLRTPDRRGASAFIVAIPNIGLRTDF